ncbi:hypothetical protein KC333_g5551 [Hortaea werneckii]|nr:hypothetical protein KC333_g5551 [Hortaea werneckii]KAI7308712.1 hypothetical protein KC326_g7314 [Hortaea werneckii]
MTTNINAFVRQKIDSELKFRRRLQTLHDQRKAGCLLRHVWKASFPRALKTNEDKLDWLAAKFETFAQCIFSHLQPHRVRKQYPKSTYDKTQDIDTKRSILRERLSLVWLELQKLEEDDRRDPGAWCRPPPRVRTSRQVTPIEEDFWSDEESTKHCKPTPSASPRAAVPMTAWIYDWEAQCYVEHHGSRVNNNSTDGLTINNRAQTPCTPQYQPKAMTPDPLGNHTTVEAHYSPILPTPRSTAVHYEYPCPNFDPISKKDGDCPADKKSGFWVPRDHDLVSQRQHDCGTGQTDCLPAKRAGVVTNENGKRRPDAQYDLLLAKKRTKTSATTKLDANGCRYSSLGWHSDQSELCYDADDEGDVLDSDDDLDHSNAHDALNRPILSQAKLPLGQFRSSPVRRNLLYPENNLPFTSLMRHIAAPFKRAQNRTSHCTASRAIQRTAQYSNSPNAQNSCHATTITDQSVLIATKKSKSCVTSGSDVSDASTVVDEDE